ncbi:methyltransferase [Fusarium subglutinans]|uniref:Methyltransferase n=1 Tax=Gibberella subglutinans TaxID=42677 RepID=A0A8H5NZG0_GIBSU|nr:methyltransferase [Fusarium subglutinans]KAF5584272.1 methyltransferase [Fusarium subglutinans]
MTDQQLRDTPTATATATATDSPPPAAAAAAPAAPSSPAPQAELIPAEDPEDTSDIDRYEIDSALGSDAASFMYPDSVTASILEYRTIQGRTYHSDRYAHEYVMPNDEQQLQSVDITHHYLTILLDNSLFLAPISPHVQRVLDVGTGSGIWAMQVSLPTRLSAQVIGSDLSPTQPEWVPPNVHFEIADATLTWPWKDNYFDFVHIRYLFGGVQDWPALFQEAYRCCAPGGWVQSCEADIHFYSDDGTTDSEPALQKWADLYEKGGAATGRTFFLQQEALQERSITEAGFTDVRIFDYKLPVGGWTSNRKLFELGEYVRLTLENDLEGYTLYLWHNVLNWPREEYPQFLAAMRKAISSRKVHGYMMVRYVYARKP